jgi:hypothetical protein
MSFQLWQFTIGKRGELAKVQNRGVLLKIPEDFTAMVFLGPV